ncbi:co-chaperone YbbN [Actinomyces lilanjuaniae]|uniref:Co-chaperone YbbN n=1 Tax=Actinomyces lilanjuaniae TaxID=2321394 RepID=A0ABN5PMC8_9ACTO|nr:tetratricopeptide repeat protein [Actinomyces lilanjuaniae]AYD89445.1 co-chaperone YbbN [Actinomyces lilanjuaniae]
MSMFGAVDLSSLVPSGGSSGAPAPGASGSGSAAGPAAAGRSPGQPGATEAGGGLPLPLVVDVDASTLRETAELSTRVPVVVVLHTPRSQASSDLAALLARLAEDYAGRFQVARVDVDAAPEVAQAFQAQAVPAVLALLAGQPVPLLQGGATEPQLRGVLDQVLEVAAANGVTGTIAVSPDASGADQAPAEAEETEVEKAAREAIEAGDFAAAEEVYTHAINQNPADDSLKAARSQVRLLARMDGQDPQALLAAADATPQDLQAVLAGADAALALGDVNAALGRVLEAVRSHTGEEREEARLRALELFEVIGATTPEVARARRMLASLLY